MFSLMQYRDAAKPAQQVIDEVIEQSQLAERVGLSATWFAEHHFSNYALCPSPLLMCAAVARATTRIRVATGVVLLPLYRPARLVSEIAFVDALSHGGLVLGVGSGYQACEFERFGEDLKDSKDKTVEFIEIIEKGLSEDFFDYQGNHYALPKTHISSRPTGAMEIWMAGDSPAQDAHSRAAPSAALSAAISSRNEWVTSKSSQPFSSRVRRAGSIANRHCHACDRLRFEIDRDRRQMHRYGDERDQAAEIREVDQL